MGKMPMAANVSQAGGHTKTTTVKLPSQTLPLNWLQGTCSPQKPPLPEGHGRSRCQSVDWQLGEGEGPLTHRVQ